MELCKLSSAMNLDLLKQLVVESLPIPLPKADEVLIKVEAAGVNFPDGLLVQGLYQMKPPHPFIPGNEVAGTIIQVGAKRFLFASRV